MGEIAATDDAKFDDAECEGRYSAGSGEHRDVAACGENNSCGGAVNHGTGVAGGERWAATREGSGAWTTSSRTSPPTSSCWRTDEGHEGHATLDYVLLEIAAGRRVRVLG